MGVANGDDDVVKIEDGRTEGEASMISVNCPDKTGLGCDLCRIILDFGLSITRGDVSTDGKWCFVVFWVIPRFGSRTVRWASLKNRLLSVCPSCSVSFYYQRKPSPSRVYLLKVFCVDRKGLLHDVTQVLSELELTIHRVKVSTTPDSRVMDLFFITDVMERLQTKKRQEETFERLNAVLGESCISCEIQPVGPEYEISQQVSPLPPSAEELFSSELSDNQNNTQALTPDSSRLKRTNINLDNSLSPGHSLLQIQCVDQKGLLYDIMRTLKDCSIQIAYGRFSSNTKGSCEVDLFIQQMDGKKIVDSEKQSALSSRLRMEMLHPLRVIIVNRGPDTELLVANPVELSGKGRPRVFYDVTLALKLLGICIFSAEIGRHSSSDRQWEVYRFLLDETSGVSLANNRARAHIVDRVRRTLMGW
ncbi:ACT domain-containing protein ACR9-like protein isoform X1 [Cinnamomum micranthum f. kanehirae]|uniref:ACT domain-containing protein ACR n=1 Tax=Cinnamomum micranthum f. kanehirae TaxID=337451 RepID=A0A443PXH4_9MAGN|nr:ACT domain-containing protein ACR9-like protein isoform X1 [Cinnamomum micranthum f. kanehirae]